jgi:hypothetical protein
MSRARIALPLVLTYWVVLLLGLVLYTAARRSTPGTDIVSILWAGSIFGTLVGHLLGLTNVRLWFTALVVGGLVLLGLAGPPSPDRNVFWMSFAPATIFAAISVGDRWSLAAFWFPAMIWMLTILDGTNGKSTPEGTAAVTLGALAVLFVIFLRVRETRRVALWKTVAARPLATPAVSTVFKEPPGKEVSRAFWMLGTSAAVFAFTAWLAPQLWEVETFGADPKITASSMGPDGDGPPCCEDLAEAERSRVKEYFDFGRGRDALTGNTETQCRQCYPDDDGGGGGGYTARLDYCTDTDFELGYCIKCTSEDIESGLCVLCTDEQTARGVCVYGRWVGSGYGGTAVVVVEPVVAVERAVRVAPAARAPVEPVEPAMAGSPRTGTPRRRTTSRRRRTRRRRTRRRRTSRASSRRRSHSRSRRSPSRSSPSLGSPSRRSRRRRSRSRRRRPRPLRRRTSRPRPSPRSAARRRRRIALLRRRRARRSRPRRARRPA